MQYRRTYSTPRSGVSADGMRFYRASKLDCDVCELKPQCCPERGGPQGPSYIHEDARDEARALASTPEYEAACRLRKKVEMLFAHRHRDQNEQDFEGAEQPDR